MRYVSEADYRALAGFRFELRRFLQFSERAAAGVGVTPKQYQALLAVRGWTGLEPITIGDLATQMHLKHHSAVGLVQRLVSRSLLQRRVSPRDRRRVTLEPTPAGERVLQALASVHKSELRRQRAQLISLLKALGH